MNKKLAKLEKDLGLIGYIGPKGIIKVIMITLGIIAYVQIMARLVEIYN